jgi:hypothetical protein
MSCTDKNHVRAESVPAVDVRALQFSSPEDTSGDSALDGDRSREREHAEQPHE